MDGTVDFEKGYFSLNIAFYACLKISDSLARAAIVADDVVIASTPVLLTALALPVIAARAHGTTVVVSRCARAVTATRAELGVHAFIVYRMMALYGQRCLYYDCQAYM